MFTALAEGFGNLDKKLNIFVALAPVAYLQDSTEKFLKYVTDVFPYMQKTLARLEAYELFGAKWDEASEKFCIVFEGICDAIGLKNVALDPYVNEYSAILQNSRV